MRKSLILVLLVVFLSLLIISCGHEEVDPETGYKYDFGADDLQEAKEKAARGEKLTDQESTMVEGFYKWKANQ